MGFGRKSSENTPDRTIVSVACHVTYGPVKCWIPVWTDQRLFKDLNRAPCSCLWTGLLQAEKYNIQGLRLLVPHQSLFEAVWGIPALGKHKSNKHRLGLNHQWVWLLLSHWNLLVGCPKLLWSSWGDPQTLVLEGSTAALQTSPEMG